MSSIAQQAGPRKVAIGVDTHKYIHMAVALDELGGRLGELTVSADSDGYARLERWAVEQGAILAFGIEGTASYGAASPRGSPAAPSGAGSATSGLTTIGASTRWPSQAKHFFATLDTELIERSASAGPAEAPVAVFKQCIGDLCNRVRRHRPVGYLGPAEFGNPIVQASPPTA